MTHRSLDLHCARALLFATLSSAVGALGAEDAEPRIDPAVLEAADRGPTEVMVLLRQQADLREAVRFRNKTEKGTFVFQRLREVAEQTQGPLLQELRAQGADHRAFWIANALWVRGNAATLRFLAQRDEVARVWANRPVRVPDAPMASTPRLASSGPTWNIGLVNAPAVWALGFKGQGVVVAGQDTGYQWDHPALQRQYRGWNGTAADHNYNWHDAIHHRDSHNSSENPYGYNSTVPCDDNGHGTHTMGIMVGDDGGSQQIGMAPGARWIGCRNMENGWGTPATYAESYQWFVAPTDLNGANPDPAKAPDVINNSWGCTATEGCTDPLILETVVENVRAAGILIVSSAGNSGSSCGSVSEPSAIYDACFTVASTSSSDTVAASSSRGPVTVDGSNRLKPDIAAPGVGVWSSYTPNRYVSMTGTSMAAPHVAGLVALLISAHPELRGQVDGIERIIERTAIALFLAPTCGDPGGTATPNNTIGWGRIDALAALALQDQDRDAMPDWWELWHRLDPHDGDDAAADNDRDGMTNAAEFTAGTDPNDPGSILRIDSIQPGPVCRITLESAVNRSYTLLVSTNPAQGDWALAGNPAGWAGTGGLLDLSHTNTVPSKTCFYRVAVAP